MSCFTSAIGDQDAVTMRFMPDVREMVPLARAEELLGEVALEEVRFDSIRLVHSLVCPVSAAFLSIIVM